MTELSAFTFPSGGEELLGLIHTAHDTDGTEENDRGVLIVVGGPQYRVGAHRQFVHLARKMAAAGLPVMRFDYTGMGDSSGTFPGFENVGGDVEAAVRTMKQRCPKMKRITVWGLCDGASVALLQAAPLEGVDQLILVNPWVWSEDNEAATMTRHYYAKRFVSAEFWRSFVSGQVNLMKSLIEFIQTVARAVRPQKTDRQDTPSDSPNTHAPYQDLMANALSSFPGRVLILLSGNDLVARDFEDRMRRDRLWRDAIKTSRVDVQHIDDADHTFSRSDWKNAVAKASIRWIQNSDTPNARLGGGA